MEIKTAIVLAAGSGRKVWPYGEFRQKCTIPVANTPIVRRVVENLIEVGCERIVVVVGHYAQQVRGALADIPNVVFVTQHPVDGTASAVLCALAHVENEPFLVVYGDIVTIPDNFRNIIKEFHLHTVEAAALVQLLGNEDASDWLCGSIATKETEGKSVTKLTGIEGHPRGGSYRLCGVYAFARTAVPYLLRNPGIVTRVPVGGCHPLNLRLHNPCNSWWTTIERCWRFKQRDFLSMSINRGMYWKRTTDGSATSPHRSRKTKLRRVLKSQMPLKSTDMSF